MSGIFKARGGTHSYMHSNLCVFVSYVLAFHDLWFLIKDFTVTILFVKVPPPIVTCSSVVFLHCKYTCTFNTYMYIHVTMYCACTQETMYSNHSDC